MANATSAVEREIRDIPGVMGVVIIDEVAGRGAEIQVFINASTSEYEVRQTVADILVHHELLQSTDKVNVFQFASKPEFASGTADRRPLIGPITVSVEGPNSEAQVSLVMDGKESRGVGTGPITPHSLRVVAATTLEAAQAFLGQAGVFTLEGVSLVDTLGQNIVVVLAKSALGQGRLVLGSALTANRPIHEATVRAALDAVNRQLSLVLSG